jgi:uncharacterized protein YdeI (YjbR/CyaY-like superfamily)
VGGRLHWLPTAADWLELTSCVRMNNELPGLTLRDAGEWRAWLADHYRDPTGVWLILAKQGTTAPTSLSYDQALEEALCHGWIDGQRRRRDASTYLQRFTPRRSRSAWSARNVTIIERLIAEGRMLPAGLCEVARAQGDGRWDAAYAGPASMRVPDELRAALAARPGAQAMFEILTSQNRYAILHRIDAAKRAETRSRRIAKYVDMLARGETIYPQKRALAD